MIYVCSLREMPTHVRALRPHGLVSLVTPEEQPPTPPGFPPERHVRVDVHDICEPCDGAIIPCTTHIRAILHEVAAWPGDAPLLVHCVAGVSRSMATALIIAAARMPGREAELALSLRQAAPHAQPNRLMIDLGDALLGCKGRLVKAVAAMGPAIPAEYGPLVRFAPLAGTRGAKRQGQVVQSPLAGAADDRGL